MLYVYFGNDTESVRTHARARVQECTDTAPYEVTPENYSPGRIIELTESTSLFGGTFTVLLDTLSRDAEAFESLIEFLPRIAESQNHFIMIEDRLSAIDKKALLRVATTQEEYTKEKEESFNAFTLTDALLARDRKTLWLLLTAAWRNGVEDEEIIGILLWQLKVLRSARIASNAEAAGLKSFVYSKARRALAQFTEGEPESLARELLVIYHDGHLGKKDIHTSLEAWTLRI